MITSTLERALYLVVFVCCSSPNGAKDTAQTQTLFKRVPGETTLEHLQVIVQQQASQIQALQALVQQQSLEIEDLQGQLQHQSTASQQQSARISSLQSKLSVLQDRVDSSVSHLQRVQQHVAFTATFSEGGPININHSAPIPFSHVITNVGNAYDAKSGVFTAPVTGVYLFLVSLRADRGSPTLGFVEVIIQQSNTQVALVEVQLDASGDLSRGTSFAAVRVTAGEKVFVTHYAGGTTIDRWWNTAFSGMLLHPE